MSKETNFDGMSFRAAFVTEGGKLLLHSEWSTDREAVIYLVDALNRNQKKIRVSVEIKGSAYVAVPETAPHIQNYYP